MRVELTQGKVAVIDAADAALVGKYRWRASRHSRNVWYATTTIGRKTVYMHRLLLPDAVMVDHTNGDGLNNRRENLRPCTQAQNLHNSGMSKRNTTGNKGVHFDKSRNKWAANIGIEGRMINLGRFTTKDEAVAARKAAELKYHGDFASHKGAVPL